MATLLRRRGWIGIVAALSVLLHAGALVRHSLVMADAAWQRDAILADLGRICHPAGEASPVPAADLPPVPVPSAPPAECPMCLGLVAAFALAGPQAEPLRAPEASAILSLAADAPAAPPSHTPHPPARGPPAGTRVLL
jgi:hypothetical protein